MILMTSTRSKLVVWLVAAFGFVATVSAARAQDWYYINRQPASLSVAQVMADVKAAVQAFLSPLPPGQD